MKFSNVALVILGSLLCVPYEVYCETWALLYTGIQSYTIGYAFEAAVARFYDTLYKQGVPKKNIIVISPDYVPFHRYNPFPGVLVHGTNGTFEEGTSINYFEHLEVDYDPFDLTQDTFFEILAGNKSAVKDIEGGSGRVIQSGPKDTVLVYFVTLTLSGYWMFNRRSLLEYGAFIEGFDRLRDENRFRQMKLIFDSNWPGLLFDDYLDTDSHAKLIGYTMGGRFSELDVCHWSEAFKAITGLCSTVGYLESLDKVLKQSNSEKLSLFDVFAEHRKLLSELPNADPPNIYGRQEVAGQLLSTFYGKKGKQLAGKSEQDVQINPSVKEMMANSIRNNKRLDGYILDEFISSQDEKNFLKNVVSRIASMIIKGISITEEDLTERGVIRMSPEKKNTYDKVVHNVKDNCFEGQDLMVLTTQPFEKLARLVDMNVSYDQIEKAVKSVCSKHY